MPKVKGRIIGAYVGFENPSRKMPALVCSRCGGSSLAFVRLENFPCECGAENHLAKRCLDCGCESVLHRMRIGSYG